MDMNELADVIGENEALNPLMEIVTAIMDFDDAILTSDFAKNLNTTIRALYTPEMLTKSANELKDSLEARGYTRASAREYLANMENDVKEIYDTLQPSEAKRELLDAVFGPIMDLFKDVIEKYHMHDIDLPMTLEEGAQVPTYAHETDTGADLYAADTVVVKAHSISNMIRTGVHIALPENWTAYIVPRSSIGAKTPLRLSNSIGVIDSSYRGPLGVLYDNISDSDYTINAGDRIAQLIILPAYHFKAHVVDTLEETERNEGGFGSSGK